MDGESERFISHKINGAIMLPNGKTNPATDSTWQSTSNVRLTGGAEACVDGDGLTVWAVVSSLIRQQLPRNPSFANPKSVPTTVRERAHLCGQGAGRRRRFGKGGRRFLRPGSTGGQPGTRRPTHAGADARSADAFANCHAPALCQP